MTPKLENIIIQYGTFSPVKGQKMMKSQILNMCSLVFGELNGFFPYFKFRETKNETKENEMK